MKKILIVDDSEPLRFQLNRDLTNAGFSVVAAVDGFDGLAKANENPDLSLMLVDITMPNMDGMSMVENVRKNPKLNSVVIFMLTTETNDDMKARAKGYNVRAWIRKPYNLEKMLEAISLVLK